MFRLREGDRPATGLEFARLLFVVEIARLGNPKDLLGCVLWLLSPASSFVTGITVPVDGGFSSYAGV
jgi:NAD(P)-dependent dehydrogenase (short-subunit alcohol dehydrogenase family)